jgi:hypothetical protein
MGGFCLAQHSGARVCPLVDRGTDRKNPSANFPRDAALSLRLAARETPNGAAGHSFGHCFGLQLYRFIAAELALLPASRIEAMLVRVAFLLATSIAMIGWCWLIFSVAQWLI